MNTLVPVRATAMKVRPAMPGTPFMPEPATVIMLTFLIAVTALIAPPPLSASS